MHTMPHLYTHPASRKNVMQQSYIYMGAYFLTNSLCSNTRKYISLKLVIFNMLKLCLGFLVDTLFCVKWLARLSIFIHADIIVLVSEFVVVVILSDCQPLWTHLLLNLKFVNISSC